MSGGRNQLQLLLAWQEGTAWSAGSSYTLPGQLAVAAPSLASWMCILVGQLQLAGVALALASCCPSPASSLA